MNYDTNSFLVGLYDAAATTRPIEPTLAAEPHRVAEVMSSANTEPMAAAEPFDDWEELSFPGAPCPQCGSIETWWDILGGERCKYCEVAPLKKSFGLLERAAKLRSLAGNICEST